MDDTIDFYYFSGTGNTLLVVKKMCDTFKKNGVNVKLHSIEKSDPKKINLKHTIGLAFPVVGLSTFPFIWKFLNSLPESDGTPIFMLDTLGDYSGGIVGPLHNKLKKKGYNPIGACEILMPWNIFYIQSEKIKKKLIRNGIGKAEKYAQALVEGRTKWGKFPILPYILYSMGMSIMRMWEWKHQQKWFGFKAKESKCSQCGICAKICPLSNIEMKEYPIYKCKCQFCMRCVSFCPNKAIRCIMNYKGKTHKAVEVGEFLNRDEDLLKRNIKIANEVKD